MLIGAEIGLVIWAIYIFLVITSLKENEALDYPKVVLLLMISVIMGGFIGILINGI